MSAPSSNLIRKRAQKAAAVAKAPLAAESNAALGAPFSKLWLPFFLIYAVNDKREIGGDG